ncbi:zinc-dependent peptidase [Maribacter litopenaei]|uniref:Zinc-dependent peptidase n=1 Tax=Maribacter litopenaei TaxID=2976127 RepID=A0ABY5Y9S1_9FLAO|nr:zinc-dependent peptidase [Maribacter litopenaei]UWX55623.1 zinc-dependent peptidase [Maribacter litopenaei]
MEIIIEILTIFLVISFLVYLLYVIYYTLDLFFLNPFERIPLLTEIEKKTIATNLPFYLTLNKRLKKRFEKRVTRFRQRKKIIFHEEVQNKEEITLLLSATGVMLTLGMADFLILSIKRILIYPSSYYSRISKQHHHGEYHPRLKTLVLSAEHLREGFRIPNDSLNPAVHEFAHALSFNVANKLNIRSFLFMIGMGSIKRLLKQPEFISQWQENQYFREYGRTNSHEFFAVAVESFVETPEAFKSHFPELYKTLQFMLNMRFYRLPDGIKN